MRVFVRFIYTITKNHKLERAYSQVLASLPNGITPLEFKHSQRMGDRKWETCAILEFPSLLALQAWMGNAALIWNHVWFREGQFMAESLGSSIKLVDNIYVEETIGGLNADPIFIVAGLPFGIQDTPDIKEK